MKIFALLSFFCVCQSAIAAPPQATESETTNQVMAVVHYDLAETVFREFIASESPKIIFHLAYGTNQSPLPTEFMSRFTGDTHTIRSGRGGIIVVSNMIVLDRVSRREAVGLGIQEFRVTGDEAEATVKYFASGGGSSWRLKLAREKGKWIVKRKTMNWVSMTMFSNQRIGYKLFLQC